MLDRRLFPMRLWDKAMKYGVWNPAAIDFTTDRSQWAAFDDVFRQQVVDLCTVFRAGEEAVAADLLPLLHVVGAEGRVEEEMYLCSFLWDEARHIDLLQRLFAELCGEFDEAGSRLHPVYRRIFDDELRPALARLLTDASPEAQVRASVTYHLVVEGVMAETGYYVFRRILLIVLRTNVAVMTNSTASVSASTSERKAALCSSGPNSRRPRTSRRWCSAS